jgi:hypothetical protein
VVVEEEVALVGGLTNGNRVVRVGEEVRRPRRATGAAVQALLRWLQANHFEAPVPLGIDAQGRDRFTYVPGDVGIPPFPAWVLEDGALASTAHLLRRFHDVTATMPLEGDLPWDTTFGSSAGRVIGHNDVCPENTVFRAGRAAAFIDFDFAAPTDPLLDLAHLLRMWVPLGVADGPDRSARLATRMRSATDGYGLDPESELQEALELSVHQAETFIRTQLNRDDLSTDYFAQRRVELVKAASAR